MEYTNVNQFFTTQQHTLGVYYHLVLGLYALFMLFPLWATYMLGCLSAYVFFNKRYTLSKTTSSLIRYVCEAIFNPIAPLIYTMCLRDYLTASSWGHLLQYTLADGTVIPYAAPYFALTTATYVGWAYAHNSLLTKYFPGTHDYQHNLLPSFFSYSRLLGAASPLLVFLYFPEAISAILWLQVKTASLLACLRYARMIYSQYLCHYLPSFGLRA